ncbi:flagellar hook protein FlgE [Natronincola ferrireducens]|uniref:Flagellar hook protein FlgE n=1 Tax=Natronincola ferrireducens TaxID=393762 RepID=A0A1G9C215_9FIRM|nr:flagellar hook protein FlgE [Natronincola ferrireducens]SDK45504.1 flagellar hook protein FlgE [Natronincola ferrireducens]
MMRSMFSAVSGLRAHQLRMDVIGNNIANVNTVGFKGSRVTFQEVFNQTLRGAGAPQQGRGGTNPQQVGLGINVASMDTFHIRGAVERTDYNTDLMINGDGFFIVGDGDTRSYTRAGSFVLDEAGNLVTPEGFKVMGYMYDEKTGKMGTTLEGIEVSRGLSFDAMSTGANYPSPGVFFEGNLNADVKPAGAMNNEDPPKFEVKPPEAGTALEDIKDNEGKSAVARDTTFTVYDELGGAHEVRLAFVKTGANEYNVYTVDKDGRITDVGPHPIEFESDGTIKTGQTMELKRVDLDDTGNEKDLLENGAKKFEFKISFEKLTQFANESDASATSIHGYKQGSLSDFAVDSNGVITGYFTNNQMRPIGQVALANFKNPAGLEKTGNNLYRVTSNSGEPMIGNPGTGGRGALNPGALEMSNVDLSREFTNMITTQRGFQANSRVITASDEMLQEVVNMKR